VQQQQFLCLQDTKEVAAPDPVGDTLPTPENGARLPLQEPPKPAKARVDGASTPESGEISEPEAPGDELTGPKTVDALPKAPPANGHPVANGGSPKRKHDADR